MKVRKFLAAIPAALKKNKKLVIAVCAAVVLLCGAVIGTVAYFTDKTDAVVNTFTVGNVQIKLDETSTNEKGQMLDAEGNVVTDPEDAERIPNEDSEKTGTAYKLIPGMTYLKDPTTTVLAGSSPCYVRMLVSVNYQEELDAIFDETRPELTELFTGYNGEKWIFKGYEVKANSRVYEFRYSEIVEADEEDAVLEPLFTGIAVPSWVTGEQLETLNVEGVPFEINVISEAIQAEGFEADGDYTAEDVAWMEFPPMN